MKKEKGLIARLTGEGKAHSEESDIFLWRKGTFFIMREGMRGVEKMHVKIRPSPELFGGGKGIWNYAGPNEHREKRNTAKKRKKNCRIGKGRNKQSWTREVTHLTSGAESKKIIQCS